MVMKEAVMRTRKHLLMTAICAVSLMLGACKQTEYSMTFASQNAKRELRLMSKVDIRRPGGLLASIFGPPELTGQYELKTAEGSSKGTFIAGKDNDKRWVKFKPVGSGAEWTVKVTGDGRLEGDDVVWEMLNVGREVSYLKVEE
jgi:hypothetical protein